MQTVVFTNGCFDLIHPGHVDLLKKARALGTRLIVGINSDRSVRAIKGSPRPFLNEKARAEILAEMRSVDEVRVFDENTPERLIREIKPDILVKGGDWSIGQIVGADFVLKMGGKVFSIPFEKDFSTSKIAEKIKLSDKKTGAVSEPEKPGGSNSVEDSLKARIEVFENLLESQVPVINRCAEMIFETVEGGSKILFCGDGSADSEYLAGEFAGRGAAGNRSLPAIALTSCTSASLSEANDEDFEGGLARQIETLAAEGDLLLAVSTGGDSPEILEALIKAREMNCRTIGLTGAGGKKLAALCDECVSVRTTRAAQIRETYIAIGHLWREIIGEKLNNFS